MKKSEIALVEGRGEAREVVTGGGGEVCALPFSTPEVAVFGTKLFSYKRLSNGGFGEGGGAKTPLGETKDQGTEDQRTKAVWF